MEKLDIKLSAGDFDAAVHGVLGETILPECGDLAMFVKPNATERGNAMVVLTFTVELPNKQRARAQAVTTAALLDTALTCLRGWKAGGHIKYE